MIVKMRRHHRAVCYLLFILSGQHDFSDNAIKCSLQVHKKEVINKCFKAANEKKNQAFSKNLAMHWPQGMNTSWPTADHLPEAWMVHGNRVMHP